MKVKFIDAKQECKLLNRCEVIMQTAYRSQYGDKTAVWKNMHGMNDKKYCNGIVIFLV